MAKKNSNVYFNLFNVESDVDQEPEQVEEENTEQFFSITAFDSKKEKEEKEPEIEGQLSLFSEEAFEEQVNQAVKEEPSPVFEANELEDETVNQEEESLEDEVEFAVADEVLEDDTLIEEIAQEIIDAEIEEEASQEFFIEPIIKAEEETEEAKEGVIGQEIVEEDEIPAFKEAEEDISAREDSVEKMLVSNLETNSLDESYVPEKQKEVKEENDSIFENVLDYDKIKKQTQMDGFETPYVYHGKNGDRIRYRISLPSDHDPKRNRLKKNVTGWVITIALALILALIIRTFVFVVATVDGPSMQPTLHNNDRLLVTKYTYYFQDVQRGDIVICKYNAPGYDDMYVKRVVGLPGETIKIVEGIVYIDGVALSENYSIKSLPDQDRFYNMDEYYIPMGHYFVMGDNRNNSADSRMESNGAISGDLIIGKAQARIYPFSSFGSLEESN